VREAQNGYNKPCLAELAASFDLDKSQMPSLQLSKIQGSGVTPIRRTTQHVRPPASSLHVLLEALLLVRIS
jgi:hypothetical protein